MATIVDRVPLQDKWFRVASELFAVTADVHRVLGNIRESDYTCSTPDGAGKSVEECMLRIARVLCADLELISPLMCLKLQSTSTPADPQDSRGFSRGFGA